MQHGVGAEDRIEVQAQLAGDRVVADAKAARQQLLDAGVDASEVDVQPWGSFVYFRDPAGNSWSLQAIQLRPNG
jgi:uncharacterized glyoxalase superfamily protein PhnB